MQVALVVLSLIIASPSYSDKKPTAMTASGAKIFNSKVLGGRIITYPTVFPPREAMYIVFPLMMEHPELFKGKSVLEIGTGSGIISI